MDCGRKDTLSTSVSEEHEEVIARILEALRIQGVPQGVWLVELEQVRASLRAADDLLRRIYDAILDGLPPLN